MVYETAYFQSSTVINFLKLKHAISRVSGYNVIL
jgi:hypothetical protein